MRALTLLCGVILLAGAAIAQVAESGTSVARPSNDARRAVRSMTTEIARRVGRRAGPAVIVASAQTGQVARLNEDLRVLLREQWQRRSRISVLRPDSVRSALDKLLYVPDDLMSMERVSRFFKRTNTSIVVVVSSEFGPQDLTIRVRWSTHDCVLYDELRTKVPLDESLLAYVME
jgi:hypothetical protein